MALRSLHQSLQDAVSHLKELNLVKQDGYGRSARIRVYGSLRYRIQQSLDAHLEERQESFLRTIDWLRRLFAPLDKDDEGLPDSSSVYDRCVTQVLSFKRSWEECDPPMKQSEEFMGLLDDARISILPSTRQLTEHNHLAVVKERPKLARPCMANHASWEAEQRMHKPPLSISQTPHQRGGARPIASSNGEHTVDEERFPWSSMSDLENEEGSMTSDDWHEPLEQPQLLSSRQHTLKHETIPGASKPSCRGVEREMILC